jgi:hypothetical protein
MHHYIRLLVVTAGAALTAQALAAPTADEIRQLGATLTPLGGEKAGNKEGTIPQWEGGICAPPAGYAPRRGRVGGGPYVDPYANDKPVLRITAANLSQYQDRIDAGTRELFKRYPKTYAMEVYPTRRSACFPNWVYENTRDRAGKPRLVGTAPGITGAHAQIPFPIPKNGHEVMWNMVLRYELPSFQFAFEAGLMDTSGTLTRASFQVADAQNLYWNNAVTSLPEDKPYKAVISRSLEPVSQVGLASLRSSFLRQDLHDDTAWSYVPGQRRVRRAPEFAYDTVSTTSGGLLLFDEIAGWDGKMDKYDFKLIGKKEMYIPYNAYRTLAAPLDQVMVKDHENPAHMRWELHRVWVVEGTLKPGERHIQKKKVFLVDEDSWNAPVYYGVDHQGQVNHLMHLPAIQAYDVPGVQTKAFILYDLSRGIYGYQTKPLGRPDQYGVIAVDHFPPNHFTPDALAGSGVR